MNLGLSYGHCSHSPCPAGFQSPNLVRCGAWQTVKYCGKPHQKADRPRHKVQCIPIKQTKDKVTEEEAKLRANPGDDTNGNPFDHSVGLFWFFKSTRPHMQARHDYISAILNVRTGEAVEIALKESLDLLRLCRGDNLGVRSQVPALYLRLGRDQEAYDFIKWYAVKGDSKYDWRGMSLPFLDLQGEDAFEAVIEKPYYYDISFKMALMLIKIRLMKDLESLQGFLQKKPNATGEERYDYVQEEAMSDILLQRADIVAKDDYKDLIAELKRQVLQLYKMVKEDTSGRALRTRTSMLSQFITFLALAGCVAAAPSPRAAKCTSYTIINTRGTGEIQGPSAGFRTMNSQITSQVPGGKIYNTVYLAGYDQNSAQGTQDIIREVKSVLASNPSECFILEGYSQGAAATVNALSQLTGSAGDAVKGVFLIGDPLHKSGLACNVDNNGGTTTKNVNGLEAFGGAGIPQNWISRTLDVCIFGDGVCDTTHGFGINAQHLQYPNDAATQNLGTTFVVKKLNG
ncbi:hypothetical protein FOXYS1_4148 [Fusarium oxysporum]|uniref:MYND-type domain-containing protein n=3 Tax=Fusarium oxysporum TaxID=5507 RepID=A0A8H5AGN4_FUSOX|nr:hypothetical protein FOXYS1_4148 [Fusarium oxysporum]